MARNYKSSNIRFNMDEPKQAYAWEYLQEHKNIHSYAEAIAGAIWECTHSGKQLSTSVDISEDSIKKIATEISRKISVNTIEVASDNTEEMSEEMMAFAFN